MSRRHLDLMSESAFRKLVADHEAALAALCETDEPFGAGLPPAMTDDEIDAEATRTIEARRAR